MRSKQRRKPGHGLLRYGPDKLPYKTDLFMSIYKTLIVLTYEGVSEKGQSLWKCLCTRCGSYKNIPAAVIMSGKQKTCGCGKTTVNGLTRGEFGKRGWYISYWHARDRATNPDSQAYESYGGNGRGMCSGWINNPVSFHQDMGERPPKLTIDRIDNTLGYYCGHCEECVKNNWPANCQWSDKIRQARFRGNTHWITCNGKTQTIPEWADELGMPYKFLYDRLVRQKLSTMVALYGLKINHTKPVDTSKGVT